MSFTLALAQTPYPQDEDVVAQVRTYVARAQRKDARLLAFPENLMCPRELTTSELTRHAEALDGPFVSAMGSIACEQGMWIVFTFYERNPLGSQPFNTAVVVDDGGAVRGTYRKCHLYDAHGVRESDRMAAGSALCKPIRTPFATLGLGICYDLRFPELTRSLAIGGCDLVLFPAAWHDGPNKALHWQTLLRARAIENELFVAGVCHADKHHVRTSHVFDPWGNELAGGTDDLLTCSIDTQAVTSARDAMPILEHRKPELYGAITANTTLDLKMTLSTPT